MGTSVHVLATEADALAPASTAVREVLEDVDRAYSRFREDSELSRLNATPGRTVRVSPLLATAIGAAQRAARLTDGAVDPTIGHAIRVAGYDEDFSLVAAKGPQQEVKLRAWRVPGWQAIRFDPQSRTVLLPAGVELDLGSTGKALAADLAARTALDLRPRPVAAIGNESCKLADGHFARAAIKRSRDPHLVPRPFGRRGSP